MRQERIIDLENQVRTMPCESSLESPQIAGPKQMFPDFFFLVWYPVINERMYSPSVSEGRKERGVPLFFNS